MKTETEKTDREQTEPKTYLDEKEILAALEGVLGRSLDGWTLWHDGELFKREVGSLEVDPENHALVFR